MELGLYALALVQLVLLVYVPNRELPTRESLAAGQRLVARLAAVDGEVLIPYQPHLATLAGKTPHAHVSAVGWLLMTSDTEPKTRVYREFERAFEEQRFRAVVSNDDWPRTFESFERNYREAGAVFANPDVFWCLTGVPTRPQTVFEPVGASPGGWTPIPD